MSFTGTQKRLAYMKLSQPRSGYRALLTRCCVAFLMLSPLSCGDDAADEDEPKFACYFESITNRDCSGDSGSTDAVEYGEWKSNCTPVNLEEDCDAKKSGFPRYFSDGACSLESRYRNIQVKEGRCPAASELPIISKGEMGTYCEWHGECESGYCRSPSAFREGLCSRICVSDADCEYSGTGTSVCAEDWSTTDYLAEEPDYYSCAIKCKSNTDCPKKSTCVSHFDEMWCDFCSSSGDTSVCAH